MTNVEKFAAMHKSWMADVSTLRQVNPKFVARVDFVESVISPMLNAVAESLEESRRKGVVTIHAQPLREMQRAYFNVKFRILGYLLSRMRRYRWIYRWFGDSIAPVLPEFNTYERRYGIASSIFHKAHKYDQAEREKRYQCLDVHVRNIKRCCEALHDNRGLWVRVVVKKFICGLLVILAALATIWVCVNQFKGDKNDKGGGSGPSEAASVSLTNGVEKVPLAQSND